MACRRSSSGLCLSLNDSEVHIQFQPQIEIHLLHRGTRASKRGRALTHIRRRRRGVETARLSGGVEHHTFTSGTTMAKVMPVQASLLIMLGLIHRSQLAAAVDGPPVDAPVHNVSYHHHYHDDYHNHRPASQHPHCRLNCISLKGPLVREPLRVHKVVVHQPQPLLSHRDKGVGLLWNN